jgi:hypothetical protein
MNVETYNLMVYFRGYDRTYYNISRTAVKYYLDWHRENPDFVDFSVGW